MDCDAIPGRALIMKREAWATLARPLGGYIGLAKFEWDPKLNCAETPLYIERFDVSYVVPPEPKTRDEHVVFLFNGMQPSPALEEKRIIQPVLQWGPSTSGGGDLWWSICSWHVRLREDDRGEIIPEIKTSRRERVAPGMLLKASIVQRRIGDGKYVQACEFINYSGTKLEVEEDSELTECGLALEAYNISHCGQLPDTRSFVFSNINIAHEEGSIVATWGTHVQATDCGISFDTDAYASCNEVSISFGAA